MLETVEALTGKGVSVLPMREGFDLATPIGEAMLTMLAAVGELERSNIEARQMAGILRARAKGKALAFWDLDGIREARLPARVARPFNFRWSGFELGELVSAVAEIVSASSAGK